MRLRYDKVSIDTHAVTDWWNPQDGDKADIADVVVRIIREGAREPSEPVEALMEKNENVRTLVESLQLENI